METTKLVLMFILMNICFGTITMATQSQENGLEKFLENGLGNIINEGQNQNNEQREQMRDGGILGTITSGIQTFLDGAINIVLFVSFIVNLTVIGVASPLITRPTNGILVETIFWFIFTLIVWGLNTKMILRFYGIIFNRTQAIEK